MDMDAHAPGPQSAGPNQLRPARMVDVHVDEGRLTLLVESDGRDVPTTIGLTEDTTHALAHVAALHGHTHACGSNLGQDVHVGLLRRVLVATGCTGAVVVVRPEPTPAFFLHLVTPTGPTDLELDLLDALVLLLSDKLPIAVDGIATTPWESTFDRLLGDRAP